MEPSERQKHLVLGQVWDSYNFIESLLGAPGSFQHFMDKIFRGLYYVTIYLDDILVYSAYEETHKAHLMELFDRSATAGVTLWRKKYRMA